MATAAILKPNTPGGTSAQRKSRLSSSQNQAKQHAPSEFQQKVNASSSKLGHEIGGLNAPKLAGEVNRRRELAKSQQQTRTNNPLAVPQARSKQSATSRPGALSGTKTKIRGIRSKIAKAKAEHANLSKNVGADKAKEKTRKAVKKAAKNVMQRGAIYAADLIASALDLGTSGVALVVDIFVYALTLGWLNVELIYGRIIMDDKDPFISALSYDPIPIKFIDPKANFLAAVVVAADIALVFAVLILFTFQLILMMVWLAPLALPGLIALNPEGFLSIVSTMFAL
jgi:hypothetical protein